VAESKVTVSPDDSYMYKLAVRNDLVSQNFQALEQTNANLLKSKERFVGGAWKLYVFYEGLNEPAAEATATDANWEMHLKFLQRWKDQFPNSSAVRIALGDSFVQYAWKARGSGYASTVTEEGWSKFKERLAKAHQILNEAISIEPSHPHIYSVMLRVAMGESWDSVEFNKLFTQAMQVEPTYYYSYRTMATHLLPRWSGTDGDWERFADDVSKRVRGKHGPILYYLISSEMVHYYGNSFFQESKASWPRIREGYRYLEELYGIDNYRLNEVGKFACLAEDQKTAKEMFDRIGDKRDPYFWSKTDFEVYKAWANASVATSNRDPFRKAAN
jgi:hypothetical protein